jgi:hypothetical protein
LIEKLSFETEACTVLGISFLIEEGWKYMCCGFLLEESRVVVDKAVVAMSTMIDDVLIRKM